jgi:hypothetical protein
MSNHDDSQNSNERGKNYAPEILVGIIVNVMSQYIIEARFSFFILICTLIYFFANLLKVEKILRVLELLKIKGKGFLIVGSLIILLCASIWLILPEKDRQAFGAGQSFRIIEPMPHQRIPLKNSFDIVGIGQEKQELKLKLIIKREGSPSTYCPSLSWQLIPPNWIFKDCRLPSQGTYQITVESGKQATATHEIKVVGTQELTLIQKAINLGLKILLSISKLSN